MGTAAARRGGQDGSAARIRMAAIACATGCGLALGLLPVAAAAALGVSPALAGTAVAGLIAAAAFTGWLAREVTHGLAERVGDEIRWAAVVNALRRPPAAQQRLRLLLPASLPGLTAATGRGVVADPLLAGAIAAAGAALASLAALALDALLVGAGALAAVLAVAIAQGDAPADSTADADQELAGSLTAALAPAAGVPAEPRLARATGPALRRRAHAGLTAATAGARPAIMFGVVAAVAAGLLPPMLGARATPEVVFPAQAAVGILVAAGYAVHRAMVLRRAADAASLTCAYLVRDGADDAAGDGDPRDKLAPVGRASRQLAGGVSLRQVTVRGGGPPVLAAADLDIAPGERVGVLVPPGPAAGILAALLTGLLDPDAGTVLLDGVDARALAPTTVWSQVAVVPQEPVLTPGTLLDNLAASEASDDRVRARVAAEMIGLDRVMALSDPVAGHWWSAGELRRLAMARALAADPAIVVLQDPAAGIDPASERLVRAAVDDLAADRTSIILSEHAPSLQGSVVLFVLGRDGTARPVTWAELVGEQQAG